MACIMDRASGFRFLGVLYRLFLALISFLCYYDAGMQALMKRFLPFILMLTVPIGAVSAEKGMTIKSARYFSYAAFTRIVFEIESSTPYVLMKTADGKSLILSGYNLPLVVSAPLPSVRDGVVRGMELNQDAGRNAVIIHLDSAAGSAKDFMLRTPDRIVVDIARGTVPETSPQEQKIITVVIDPGHGNRDTGIVTAQGAEKTVTLEIALAVKKNLQRNPRFKIVLTREKDQMLSLDERAAASNAAGASIFVSIHGTSDAVTQVYMQDLADDIPARTAGPVRGDFLGFEAGSEQQMLWGKQQAAHVQESRGLGRSLAKQLMEKDGGDPVQAPLAELKAVDAAAVLVECVMTKERAKNAEAIAMGIEQYVRENR